VLIEVVCLACGCRRAPLDMERLILSTFATLMSKRNDNVSWSQNWEYTVVGNSTRKLILSVSSIDHRVYRPNSPLDTSYAHDLTRTRW